MQSIKNREYEPKCPNCKEKDSVQYLGGNIYFWCGNCNLTFTSEE